MLHLGRARRRVIVCRGPRHEAVWLRGVVSVLLVRLRHEWLCVNRPFGDAGERSAGRVLARVGCISRVKLIGWVRRIALSVDLVGDLMMERLLMLLLWRRVRHRLGRFDVRHGDVLLRAWLVHGDRCGAVLAIRRILRIVVTIRQINHRWWALSHARRCLWR